MNRVYMLDLAGDFTGRSQGADEIVLGSPRNSAHPEMFGKIGKDLSEVLFWDAGMYQPLQDPQVLLFIVYRCNKEICWIPFLQDTPAFRSFNTPG
jgi:hypothetical protein